MIIFDAPNERICSIIFQSRPFLVPIARIYFCCRRRFRRRQSGAVIDAFAEGDGPAPYAPADLLKLYIYGYLRMPAAGKSDFIRLLRDQAGMGLRGLDVDFVVAIDAVDHVGDEKAQP